MPDEQEVPTEVAEEVTQEIPAEESETPEVAETPEEPETIPEPPKKKETAQEMANRLTRARREAEREKDYWKRVALERDTVEKPQVVPPVKPTQSVRPRLEQFETTEAYEDAVADWKYDEREARRQVAQQQTKEQEALKKFNKAADKLRVEHDDFDEIIEAPVFTPVMREVIANMENGPEVAYYLGKPENRDTAERILSLPFSMQPYEISKLETQLLVAQKTKKVPGAPPPIKPVGGSGATQIDESKLTDDEWYALEQKRRREKIENRYKPK